MLQEVLVVSAFPQGKKTHRFSKCLCGFVLLLMVMVNLHLVRVVKLQQKILRDSSRFSVHYKLFLRALANYRVSQ